jgi:hypothetical protein
MSENPVEMHFARLHRLLSSSDVEPEEREARVQQEVQAILEALSQQPEQDQTDIRAALFHLGVLPDRRTGRDRREGRAVSQEIMERRTGRDRRQPRDPDRWLPGEE